MLTAADLRGDSEPASEESDHTAAVHFPLTWLPVHGQTEFLVCLYMVPWISPNMTVHNICRVDRCRQRSARQRGVSSESTPYSAAPLDVRVASDSLFSFRSSTGASVPFPARQPPRGGNRRPQVLVRADCSRPVRRRFGNSPCFKSDRVLVPSH